MTLGAIDDRGVPVDKKWSTNEPRRGFTPRYSGFVTGIPG
jgi:hypothetical protein